MSEPIERAGFLARLEARLPDPALERLALLAPLVYAVFLLVSPLRVQTESDSTLPIGFALGRALWGEARMNEPAYQPINGAIFVTVGLLPVLVLYALIVRAAVRRRGSPGLGTILAATLACSGLLACFPRSLSSDVFSYMVYGRLEVIYHANALVDSAQLHPDAFVDRVGFEPFRYVPSAYGPVWLALSRGVTHVALALGGSVQAFELAYKALAIACHAGCAALLWRILGRVRPADQRLGTVLYAWNPLMLVETAWNPHNDVVVLLAVLAAIACHVAGRRTLATVLLALSVPIKWVTLVLVPLYLVLLAREAPSRAVAARRVLVASALTAAVFVAAFAPWWRGPATLDALVHAPSNHFAANSVGDYALNRLRWAQWHREHPGQEPPSHRPGAPPAHDPGTLIADGYEPVLVHWRATHRFDWSRLAPKPYASLEAALRLLGALLVAAVFVAVARGVRDVESLARAGFWTLFAYLACAALWFWPWYLVWCFGIACLLPWSAALRVALVFSISASMIYFAGYLGGFGFDARALFVFAPPLAQLAWERRRRAG